MALRDFQIPGRSLTIAERGMCATSHPLAARAALAVLEDGGNAVDAAIAGAVLLGICEPQMCGIGGDCFVLISPPGADAPVIAMNGSGRAPAAARPEHLKARGLDKMPLYDVETVTIPGAIDAFCRLSDDHGKVGLERILAPAIDYAESGVPVAPRVAYDWPEGEGNLIGRARDFYLRDGRPYRLGEIFRAPGQADVLRRIAAQGRAGFYEGEVAADMVASLRAMGGVHQTEDLAANQPDYTRPVSGTYKGLELLEHPPNGQGATAILLLNILKHFDIAGLDPFGAERVHLEAEASKLAYDARNRFIADPDHTSRLDHMLAPETAAQLARLIRRDQVLPAGVPAAGAVHRDTIYITVVDRDRLAVSLIYSIFWGFGSGRASERFGILFQNRGAGFTLSEGHPNEYGGGKRPMHTIIPGMLRQDGRTIMPFGVMGGAFQPAGHARFVSNLTDFGMDPQTAIDAPRSFFRDGVLEMETGYRPDVIQSLADLGHKIVPADGPLGGAQAIRIDHEAGILVGASDPRKDGCALGY